VQEHTSPRPSRGPWCRGSQNNLGQLDNTIVVFTTDNGAEANTFPEGGVTPFKGQKGDAWEGGYRAPAVIRWPGHIPPGTARDHFFLFLRGNAVRGPL
jgi:arylsulfatase A-like enzyme